jgi:hypothetical protein
VAPPEAPDQDQHVEVAMAELEFTRTEVEDLAQKLDAPQSQLTRRERALVLAIFSAARNLVRPSGAEGSVAIDATLANLREELVNAFIPGDATRFVIAAPNIIPDR